LRREEDADPEKAATKRAAFEQPGGVTIDSNGNAIIGNLNGVAKLSVTRDPRPDTGLLPPVIMPGLDRAHPDSPQGRLESNKRELLQRTVDAVFAVLTPAQQAKLPKPSPREMLSREERMRQVMEKAFREAVITRNDDGSITFELTLKDEETPEQ
jgi:hypothetical protein